MEAKRTLVKSPPELWAELSDVAALARHLGEFGEIRITRTEPETVVEWEGDRASGTVLLEPSGWGTKVTLTSEPAAPPAKEEPASEAPVGEEPSPEQGPPAVEEPPAEEPPALEAPPALDEPGAPERPRRGLFARLLSWRRAARPVEAAPPEPAPEEPEAPPLEPAPVEPEPAALEPAPKPPAIDDERAAAILNGVLDALGAAHHRPFSR
jgi:hypothetical protein